jgi:predicted PurR-regulated permease PerM
MTAETEPRQLFPNVTARQVAVGTLVVVAVAGGFWLLVQRRIVVLSLFEALVVGTAISPGVEWLHRRGVPRPVGVVLIYLALLAVLAAFVLVVAPMLADQSASIGATFGTLYSDALNTLRQSPSGLIRRVAWRLPGDVPAATPAAQEEVALEAVARALEYTGLIGRGLFVLVAVLLMAFYWTLDRERITRSLLLLAPADRREGWREFISAAEEKVGGYVRGVALLCAIIGSLALIAWVALGLPNALLLGLAAGVFEAIPIVGPALGALPAALVAFSVDPHKVIWVILIFSVIQGLENMLLVPRVMGKTVGVSPMVSLIALVAFGAAFGPVGAVLAVPLAAVIQLLLDRFVLGPEAAEPDAPARRDRLSVLRYQAQSLVQDARKQLREKPVDLDDESDELDDAIEALATDLDSLLARPSEPESSEA